jgi:peptidoglycan/xylan/chitin deacetylase (PgdA/CDA1 family)
MRHFARRRITHVLARAMLVLGGAALLVLVGSVATDVAAPAGASRVAARAGAVALAAPSPTKRPANPVPDASAAHGAALLRRAAGERWVSGTLFGLVTVSGRGGRRDGRPNAHDGPPTVDRFPDGVVAHVPILMYHRVVAPRAAGHSLPGLVVSPARFEAQMAALQAAGWHAVTAGALAADLAAGRRPPPRTFVATFDDGWADGYTNAFPILQRHGFVGTFFVVTGRLGHAGVLSPQQLQVMQAAGMEIGDHTVRHVDLPLVRTRSAVAEVVGAADRIASIVGQRPLSFAYPFGGQDARDHALVANAGFLLAVTTHEGCRESTSNEFAVPRLRVGPDTSPSVLVASMERCWAMDRPATH